MRKIFALLITLFYIAANSCSAFSELYYLNNTTENALKNTITSNFSDQNFKIIRQNPFYGTSQKNTSEYAVVILQQSGNNVFYYYTSNYNTKLNKNILKDFKRSGISYEQSQNQNVLTVYDRLAQQAMTNTFTVENRYTFEEPKQNTNTYYNNQSTARTTARQTTALQGYVGQVSEGAKIETYLQNPINTSTANKGDQVIAVLTKDWTYNGYVVAPQGSLVYGTLTKARHATYGSRNGRVVIDFTQIVTPENKTYNISTEEIDFTVTNEGKFAKSAGNVVAGAAIGALAGLLFAALGSNSLGTAAAIGAGVGAGSALIGSTAERGIDAEIPSFTELELTLTKPINVTVNY